MTAPGDSASRRRIFVCRPSALADDLPCARRILSMLARRAYRRPVTDVDLRDVGVRLETLGDSTGPLRLDTLTVA